MAQFMVYHNEDSASKEAYPYLLDVQSALLDDLDTRVVIPVSYLADALRLEVGTLCPVIPTDKGDMVLMTHHLTSVRRTRLTQPYISLDYCRYEIVAALDLLITGV